MVPTTRYARSGDATIAYQVAGEGALDLLFLPGWISQIEQLWEAPAMRRFLERLAVFSRLILFDRRGSGLSDGVGEPYTLEHEARDALAVLDAAGSERAALLTYGLGGPVGALLAADRPERVGALIMYASIARTSWAPDYDWAMTVEDRAEWTERTVAAWGETDGPGLAVVAPSMADDPALTAWFARLQRLAASPSAARTLLNAAVDARCARHAAAHPGPDAGHAPNRRHARGTRATRATSPSTSPARATSSWTASTRCRSSATAMRSSRRSRSS